MKYHIIGMAKSTLWPLKPGSARNLELDVLRLIYTINYFEQKVRKDEKIFGFMLVHNDKIKHRITDVWLDKYKFDKHKNFKVLTFDNLEPSIIQEIIDEKDKNSSFENSTSDKGKNETEKELTKQIEKNMKTILQQDKIEFKSPEKSIIDVNWDYYKIIEINDKI